MIPFRQAANQNAALYACCLLLLGAIAELLRMSLSAPKLLHTVLVAYVFEINHDFLDGFAVCTDCVRLVPGLCMRLAFKPGPASRRQT